MENSPAKDCSRELFYGFVKQTFNKAELKQARALVLLGKNKLELPYLDKLGVSRHRVTSIEKDPKVYRDQHLWNMHQDPKQKVELFSYDLTDYLRFLRDRNQSVEIFNLDICGSLQNNILPQFKNIITMTKKQSKTVIGTYLTAGRDQHVMLRTLEPVVWLLLFNPQFKTVIEQLVDRFVAAGYSTAIAFHHSFRVMQWLYSMLIGLTSVWYPQRAKMMEFKKIPQSVWAQIFSKNGRSANILTWEIITQATEQTKIPNGLNRLSFSCGPTNLEMVAYRNSKWTQLCHFIKLEQKPGITFESIIDVFIKGLLEMKYVDRDKSQPSVLKLSKQPRVLGRQEVLDLNWVKKLRARLKPLNIVPPMEISPLKQSPSKNNDSVKRAKETSSPNPRSLWTKRNKFSQEGLTFLRAKVDQGLKPKEIAQYFPKATPQPSISAYVALHNRKPNKKGKEVKSR